MMRHVIARCAIAALAIALAFGSVPASAATGPQITNYWVTNCTSSSGTTYSCTFTITNQAPGNALLLVVGFKDLTATGSAPTLTTPSGWTALDASAINSIYTRAATFYQKTSSRVSSITLAGTVTNNDAMYVDAIALEFANYNATFVDQHAGFANCSSNPCTGYSETPTQASDTVIGIVVANALTAMAYWSSVGSTANGFPLTFFNGAGNYMPLSVGIAPNYSGVSAQTPTLNVSGSIIAGIDTVLLNPGTLGSYAGATSTSLQPALYPAGPGGYP